MKAVRPGAQGSGIADLALAAVLIAGWPGSAAWALGLIAAENLITSGVATLMVATTAQHAVKTAERAVR